MTVPQLSDHFQGRAPSPIRQAQILLGERPDRDELTVINLAIGNVSLPMHPALIERLGSLTAPESPFADGVVRYSASAGRDETRAAFLNIVSELGVDAGRLSCLVTDGASMSMELMILGTCGPGSSRPLLLLDPAYTNYVDMAKRVGVPTVSIGRELGTDSTFALPDVDQIANLAERERPAALVVVPYDNPTGQFMDLAALAKLAEVCVRYNMWLVSDEAYRQLGYTDRATSSVWLLDDDQVPGVEGRRISLETASKVWNACGLRVGALVTDHAEFGRRAVAEHTANLCSNVLGQYVFGALAHESHSDLRDWYRTQRDYYRDMMVSTANALEKRLPGIIVSRPEASLYSVLDLRNLVDARFESADFVAFCARRGRVELEGTPHTLLLAPMGGFYATVSPAARAQLRLAFVEQPEAMARVPELLARLLDAYTAQ